MACLSHWVLNPVCACETPVCPIQMVCCWSRRPVELSCQNTVNASGSLTFSVFLLHPACAKGALFVTTVMREETKTRKHSCCKKKYVAGLPAKASTPGKAASTWSGSGRWALNSILRPLTLQLPSPHPMTRGASPSPCAKILGHAGQCWIWVRHAPGTHATGAGGRQDSPPGKPAWAQVASSSSLH